MVKLSKTLKEAYKTYPHNITERDPYYVNKSEYRDICVTFNELVVEKCMKGFIFHMPHYLGKLYIKKKKIPIRLQKRKVDYKLSKQYKKTIYHSNNHSDQYYARWFWDKDVCKVANKRAYNFKATRTNNRLLAKNIKINNTINNYLS